MNITEKLEQVLDKLVRQRLQEHGGDVEVVSVEDGVLYVRLMGACANCISAQYTVQETIKIEVCNAIPEIKNVVLSQGVSAALMEDIRKVMNRKDD